MNLFNKFLKPAFIVSLLTSGVLISGIANATNLSFIQHICFNLSPAPGTALWMGSTSQDPVKGGSPSGNPHIYLTLPDGKTGGDWYTNSQPESSLLCSSTAMYIPYNSEGTISDSTYNNATTIPNVTLHVVSPNFGIANSDGSNAKDGYNCGSSLFLVVNYVLTYGNFTLTTPNDRIVINVANTGQTPEQLQCYIMLQ